MKERRPNGYWKSEDNVLREARTLMQERDLESLPGADTLRILGYSSLAYAISRNHGGYSVFRRKLGEESPRKPEKYWRSLDNTLTEALLVLEEHDLEILPSQKQLHRMGYSALATAIGEYHEGFHKFRKLLGQEPLRVKTGSWKDLDYTLGELRRIMGEHNIAELPSSGWLKEHGYSSIGGAVSTYHGGFRKVRGLLGQEQKIGESGKRKNQNVVVEEARALMEKYGFDMFPSERVLRELGCSGLVRAIEQYHGGMRNFRELLGEEQREREKGIWKNLDYTFEQARRIMQEHGLDELPTQQVLNELGGGSLVAAITKYHGGIVLFRELLKQRQGLPSESKRLEGMLETYVGEVA